MTDPEAGRKARNDADSQEQSPAETSTATESAVEGKTAQQHSKFSYSGPSIYANESDAPGPVPRKGSDENRDQHEAEGSGDNYRWISPHVPNWEALRSQHAEIAKKLEHGPRIETVVLAADIRRSTFLMREARDPNVFAGTLNRFISEAQGRIFHTGGWFDKFTGDGFLAYWPYGMLLPRPEDDWSEDRRNEFEKERNKLLLQAAVYACRTAKYLFDEFNKEIIPRFRLNSRNFPRAAGLAMGMDSGLVSLLRVAGDLTIVGPAVVGAVRMTSAATEANETVANVSLGEFLSRNESLLRWHNNIPSEIRSEYRSTKEYPDGQEVYTIRFGPQETTDPTGEQDSSASQEKPPDPEGQGADKTSGGSPNA